MDILKITLSALMSVGAIFIITKLMGHKQVAQLDFFDYVCGITVGSIAAELATELESPEKPLIALAIYGVISMILNLATTKFPKSRKYINGTPTVLMSEGKIYRDNLRKAKLDLSEFLLLCREAGYFNPSEIQAAIFEHNGRLSVLPKSKHRPLTPSDIELQVKSAHPGTEIIMDGKVMGENLKRLGLDEIWLNKRLAENGYKAAAQILLGVYYKNDDTLLIFPMD